MPPKISVADAYARGKAAVHGFDHGLGDLVQYVEGFFPGWRREYPKSAQLDYRQEIVAHWQERLGAALDLTRYPECRGLADVVRAENQGYLDECGDPVRTAYFYNWHYYALTRLSTRYFGFTPEMMGKTNIYAAAGKCSAVLVEDSKDGPLAAKNLDTTPLQKAGPFIPQHHAGGKPFRGVRLLGGATGTVHYDEEPREIFPVKLADIEPDDIRTVKDKAEFLQRYQQFVGAGNGVWMDETGATMATEHSNCRMGYRLSSNGISAVTALAFTTPGMKEFRLERDRLSLQLRGWDETAPDWCYWAGCRARYERLLERVEVLAKEGPSLVGLAKMMLDPEGVPPARISVANEPFHPDVQADFWTMYSWSTTIFGPRRRTYRWYNTPKPSGEIFRQSPTLELEPDVEPLRREFAQEWLEMNAIGK